MAIKIKRSTGNLAPAELAAGQLAYVEGVANGGTLYYGEIGGTVREIGGRKYVDKLNGIEAGAQVNTVLSVNAKTGAVVLTADDVGALESADIGVSVQAYNANTVIDANYVHTDNNYTTAEKSKLAGIEAGAQVNTVTSVAGRTGAITLGVADVSGAESTANKGQANGYASLDAAGLVPASQLPSYVDDVVEVATFNSLPVTGESSKIYVTIDTGKAYRWTGTGYLEIVASPGSTDSLAEGSTNLYYTDARARLAISVSDLGGDGSLSYDNATGVISFTGPSAEEVRAHFTAGGGIDITDGVITNINPIGIQSLSEDLAPTLGGQLDTNGQQITNLADGNVSIASGAGGKIYLDGYAWPNAGLATDGQLLSYEAATGNLVWVTPQPANPFDQELNTTDSPTFPLIYTNRVETPLGVGGLELAANGGFIGLGPSESDGILISTGKLTLNGSIWPLSSGGPGQVLTSDGAGVLSWSDAANPFDQTLDTTDTVSFAGLSVTGPGTVTIAGGLTVAGQTFPGGDGTANQILATDGLGNLYWTNAEAIIPIITNFTGLTDTPVNYVGAAGYYVKVNSAATGLEFSADVDDGVF